MIGGVFLLGGMVLVPRLTFRALGARRASGEARDRLLAACRRIGFEPQQVLVHHEPSDRIANAMVTGPIRRFAVLVVTDQILERFSQDELEAVLAHEFAHVRGHHVLLKVGTMIGTIVVAGVALAGLVTALGIDPGSFVIVILLVLSPTSVIVIQGALGGALERRADDYAARVVGADPTRRALEHLAEINMAKRRTGRMWNLLTQHPGLDDRIKRLEASRSGTDRSLT